MNIDPIDNGIVIDHITAGNGMQLYELLGLSELSCSIAIIKNVSSKKMMKKDIIKIGANINIDLDVIGYIESNATVNIIKNGALVEKKTIEMPEKLFNVIKCKNPRCITSTEHGLDHIFKLTDRDNKIYRCLYCEVKDNK